jgi:hypothetical protein
MDHSEHRETFGPFLPLCLLGISVVLLLTWNLYAAIVQRMNTTRLMDQQALQMNQAAQLEEKLQNMMSDLLILALTDVDAKAIVKKYKVTSKEPSTTGMKGESAVPDNDVAEKVPAQKTPTKKTPDNKASN